MGQAALSRYLKWPLVVVLLTALVLSAIWHYLEYEQRNRLEQALAERGIVTQSLQKQLSQQKDSYRQLNENFGRVQEERLLTEARLREFEARLRELTGMEWDTKYEAARLENETLRQEYAEAKRQHEIETGRLERAQNFLIAENNNLKSITVKRAESNEDLMENISQLETENKQFKKTITRLESIPEKLPETKPESVEPAPAVAARTGPNKGSDVYRHVRLQSLSSALLNRDSTDRMKILVSVIPTIPNGVSGSEFLSLVSGMQSEDILAAIRMTHQHIIRPLDSEVIGELVANMSEKDAESAGVILYSGE